MLPVTVVITGGGGAAEVAGLSPGLVTRVVVVVGELSLLVRVTASPPTATAANAAAVPNRSGGRRYHGSGGATSTVGCPSGSNSTTGRAPVSAA